MAKTFNDFMVECAAYPYSQEHLDLMKECSELQLTCQYITNQLYMQENAGLFGPTVDIASGYMCESVDDVTIEALCEAAGNKSKAIHIRIWRSIQKLINVFRSFFSKIANKFDDVTVAAEKARERLAEAKLDEAAIKRLEQIVKNGLEKSEGFVPHDRQPFTKKLKMNYTSNSPEYTKLRANLAAALSDDVSVAEAFASKGGENMGAVPAEDIEAAVEQYMLGDKALAGVAGTLASAFASTKVDGIAIKVNTGEIKKTAERLEKIQEKLNKKVQKMVDEVNAAGNQAMVMGEVIGKAGSAAEREAAHAESVEYFEEHKTGKKQARSGGPSGGGSQNPPPTPTPQPAPADPADAGKKSMADKVKEGAAKAKSKAEEAQKKAGETMKGATGTAGAVTSAGGAAMSAAGANATAAAAMAANKAHAAITSTIGATTKVYTGLNKYRTSVVNELNSFLKSYSGPAASTGTEAPKAEEQKPEEKPKEEEKK